MQASLDRKRIVIYLAFSFGLAWLVGLVVYLTGGLANSQQLVPGVSVAMVLLAGGYMMSPALAHVLTRLITREGWRNVGLRPNLRREWPYWLICWFAPGLLTLLGAAIYFITFPQHYDPSLGRLQEMLKTSGAAQLPITPKMIVILQLAQALLIAPLINGLFTFGEEFGWRAYLQPRLLPLGERRAYLLMGVIWGVWHWPFIAMGHNYGLDYVGAPWLGMLAMIWFTRTLGTLLGWASLRAGSVWPAVIGHAAINGIAGIGVFFTQGEPNPLLGPLPVGLIGSTGLALVAFCIWLRPRAAAQRTAREEV